MHSFQSTIGQNRIYLETVRDDLLKFESELYKPEKSNKGKNIKYISLTGLFASSYKYLITKVNKVLGRLLRFKLDKEQVDNLLKEILIDLNRFNYTLTKYRVTYNLDELFKPLIKKAKSFYEGILKILPNKQPIQLSLFGVNDYKVIVEKPVIPRVKKSEPESIGTQLSLF